MSRVPIEITMLLQVEVGTDMAEILDSLADKLVEMGYGNEENEDAEVISCIGARSDVDVEDLLVELASASRVIILPGVSGGKEQWNKKEES